MLPSAKKICPMCEGCGYLNVKTNVKYCDSQENVEFDKNKDKNVANRSNIDFVDSKMTKTSKNHRESPNRFFHVTTDCSETLEANLPHGESKTLVNLQESLRLALQKLKENNWESNVSALLNIVHVSRIQPDFIDPSMPLITRSLNSLMKNVRPQVIRTACQIAEELFKTMQCAQRPEFDELVWTLLRKTSHMNKDVRRDANRALDAAVVYIPAAHCISAMFGNNGASHKNPIVRSTVSRLLYDAVRGLGVETFLTGQYLKDTRKRTFLMCIEFLNDACTETRCNARRLMQLLMGHGVFDLVFSQDVEKGLIKRIDKQLVELKYTEKIVN